MKIEYSCITDKGSVREKNEDSILCDGEIVNLQDHYESAEVRSKDINDVPLCFAVADGLGGHDAGEVASRVVLAQLLAEIKKNGNSFLLEPELLKGVIEAIHTDISALGINKVKKEMGSTLVGALFNREKFIVFNAGDSRLYMFRDGYLAQKTRDHSLAEQVGGNVPRNYIISCIGGGFKDIMIDIYDLTGKVKVNDLVILCSDGLTDIDMDKNYNDLENIIKNNITDLQKMNRELLSFSLEKGSSDNVSVVSVFFKE